MNFPLIILLAGLIGSVSPADPVPGEQGVASYYHHSLSGRRMANGHRYNPAELTCAHLTAPFGTVLRVARKDDPLKTVTVTVTDRGPFVEGRIIDLSRKAAEQLDLVRDGIAEVEVYYLTQN